MHMNNVLQIWEVSTYLQSKYASHGHMYEVFYSFVLVFESKTHTRTALHVSIAKKMLDLITLHIRSKGQHF